jgi:hypothetical protein
MARYEEVIAASGSRTPRPEREIDPRRPPAGPVPGTSDRRWREDER